MYRILFLMMLVVFSGCGAKLRVTPMQPEITELDVDDPTSIATWEASFHNYNAAKIVVLDASYLHGNLAVGSKPSPNRIAVEIAGARDNGISPSQQRSIDFLAANERAIFELVRDSVYDDYLEQLDDIRSVWGDEPDVAPLIETGNELDSLVTFGSYFLHHPNADGLSSFGIQFWVPWTDDDLGILLDGLNVVSIGQAYDAMPGPPE